jgi:flavin reductase (DIM6/NTAB) family NADH-FMN oxidoreductase RutF
MKTSHIIFAAATVILASCGGTQNNGGNNGFEPVAVPTKIQNVEGRVNFGFLWVLQRVQNHCMIATYDANQNPDVMMAAWGGQCGINQITFDLSPHKTTDNLRLKKVFTVSFATADDVAQSDYFGIVSGNDVPDKVKRAGFTAVKSPNIDAPIIEQYKLTLECRVIEMEEKGNGGARVVGEIINSCADESILTNGKVDIMKLRPIIFHSADASYHVVGDSVGQAWGAGKRFE